MPHFQNFIDGVTTPALSNEIADIYDPCTGDVYATAVISGPSDVHAAMSSAQAAFAGWRHTTPAERQSALLRLADALQSRSLEIAEVECRDTGKPLDVTLAEEIAPVIDLIRFFAGAARVVSGAATTSYVPGHTSSIRREPIGVCAQITPWNYPFMMAAWKWAPAIAAGNCVVLKPSDTTPASTLLTAQIAAEFLPPGVFNVICGDRTTGRLMVEHPIPELVALTGSVRAGREVMATAAGDLKNVHLELGGKAPAIVFADVELDTTADAVLEASFFNAGQDCTAITRVLVEQGVYDSFVSMLAEKATEYRTGPGKESPQFGPLNSAWHRASVEGFVERLPEHARVVAGGHAVAGAGYYFEPTVVADARQDDEIVQNEVFGPVITVQPFANEDEAVRLANDVSLGLASSVWTHDAARASRVSADLDFGIVWINTHMVIVAEMPHGGFKHSGSGKDLSLFGLEDYTRVKHVMSDDAR